MGNPARRPGALLKTRKTLNPIPPHPEPHRITAAAKKPCHLPQPLLLNIPHQLQPQLKSTLFTLVPQHSTITHRTHWAFLSKLTILTIQPDCTGYIPLSPLLLAASRTKNTLHTPLCIFVPLFQNKPTSTQVGHILPAQLRKRKKIHMFMHVTPVYTRNS